MRVFKTIRFKQEIKSVARVLLLLISGRTVIDSALDIAKYKGLEAAVWYVRKKSFFYRPRSVRFILLLYEYLIRSDLEYTSGHYGSGTFIIHFCCWGQDYTEKAIKYLLPSINATNNLHYAAKVLNVELLIHCDEDGKSRLSRSAIMNELRRAFHIRYLVLPQPLLDAYQSCTRYPNVAILKRINAINHYNKYLLLGALQGYVLKLALQHKTYLSLMMPDFLLSDTFLKEALTKIENRTFIATTTFRTDYQSVKSTLDQCLETTDYQTLSITPSRLTALQIDHMHAAAKRRVVSTSTQNFVPSAQLIFEHKDGFIIRAFHCHPILINCSRLSNQVQIDYLPVDFLMLNQFVTQALSYEEQIWVCHDSSHIAVMELSEPTVEELPHEAGCVFDAVELCHKIQKMISNKPHLYDTPLNHYFLSIRHRVLATREDDIPNGICRDHLIDDEVFLNAVKVS